MGKKKMVYKQVPKPLPKEDNKMVNEVNCRKCGTSGNYSLEDMLNHADWCTLAQQETAAQAAQAKKSQSKTQH